MKTFTIKTQNKKTSLYPSPLAGEGRRSQGEGYKKTTVSHRIYTPYVKKLARDLRTNQTKAERKLWSNIRNNQFGVKFKRQFAIDNKYIADFVCLEKRLIVEIDGGQHCESLKDIERTQYLQYQNFRVIRFWNNEVLGNMDGCLEVIKMELNKTFTTPHPIPLPQGEREPKN